ncbi:YkvA family protein [Limnoglobus roseus]|uniref:DUF1232 domain-containing protein n=1 Tax=Limnoglobus roseus TaxID=2598579 RepID=A0A5C1AM88_9BACT|nr:YkvA family protein [Limnoglobus roseus]QEL19283.1 hypothetical protein PX52LOC_06346 [Limnoglobus roseus]
MKRALCIAGAFIYLACPIDLMPEILFGPFGYIDDIVVMALAFGVTGKIPEQLRGKATEPVKQLKAKKRPRPQYVEDAEILSMRMPGRTAPPVVTFPQQTAAPPPAPPVDHAKIAEEAARLAVAKAIESLSADHLKQMLAQKTAIIPIARKQA